MADISPNKNTIFNVFMKFYHIDFYQREYKWDEFPVEILLKDIFDKFNSDYKSDIEAKSDNIKETYGWYYLNTYITNENKGREYIVDGQQRLTTLSLILIQLAHLAKFYNSKLHALIEQKIHNINEDGEPVYYMGDKNRSKFLKELNEKSISDLKFEDFQENITVKNMYNNSLFISKYLKNEIKDIHRFESFVLFFLHKIILINLDISKGNDVPMVFEVINDRGMKLNPHEILKGKLLSQINKQDVDEYCNIWENSINRLEYFGSKMPDEFFTAYFKAKLATSRAEGRYFDSDYHKTVFKNDYDKFLKFKTTTNKNNIDNIKSFIKNDFNYYAKLYCKLNKYSSTFDNKQPYVYYNYLTQMEAYKLIVIAACSIDDENEEEKIKEISRLWDRHYVLLVLNGVYDSNNIQDNVYTIIKNIKNSNIENYKDIFNNVLIERLKEKRSAEDANNLFTYNAFKLCGYSSLKRTFMRYFFMRIEQYISSKTGKKLQDTPFDFVNGRKKDGYDIEHILSRNEESISKFKSEDEFNEQRNLLGGLLLLKSRDNSASQNELYNDKLKTYASSLYWNQTLTESFYHCKPENKDFVNQLNKSLKGLNIEASLSNIPDFDENALNDRTKILFGLTQLIWA